MTDTVSATVPYRRLSFFYLLYFALLGCIAPFWGLYLQSQDFNPQQIGWLMAIFAGVRILAPNLWAYWAKYFSSPIIMVRVAGLLTAVCFSFIWLVSDFLGFALVMVAYGFFWAAMLPQYETITMQVLNNKIDQYSKIRLWGSIGFIAVVLLLGWLFDLLTITLLPIVMLVLMILICINSYVMSNRYSYSIHKSATERSGFRGYVFRTPVVIFILITVLSQISHGAYYTFFSIYLESLGYSSTEIGLLWALGVLAEVVLFWQFQHLMKYLSWRNWLVLSLILTAVRWWIIAEIPEQTGWLLLAQIAHAFSFGAMHVVSMRYIQHFFPPRLQARGQAMYSSVGFGLGGALGAWLSGLLWAASGGSFVFMLSALIALSAAIITAAGLRESD